MGWTQREIAMGATSKQQKERQRAAGETRKMTHEDKRSQKVRAVEQRQEKEAIAQQKRREEAESSAMAEEDKKAWLCRSVRWKTPDQILNDKIDKALALGASRMASNDFCFWL